MYLLIICLLSLEGKLQEKKHFVFYLLHWKQCLASTGFQKYLLKEFFSLSLLSRQINSSDLFYMSVLDFFPFHLLKILASFHRLGLVGFSHPKKTSLAPSFSSSHWASSHPLQQISTEWAILLASPLPFSRRFQPLQPVAHLSSASLLLGSCSL